MEQDVRDTYLTSTTPSLRGLGAVRARPRASIPQTFRTRPSVPYPDWRLARKTMRADFLVASKADLNKALDALLKSLSAYYKKDVQGNHEVNSLATMTALGSVLNTKSTLSRFVDFLPANKFLVGHALTAYKSARARRRVVAKRR